MLGGLTFGGTGGGILQVTGNTAFSSTAGVLLSQNGTINQDNSAGVTLSGAISGDRPVDRIRQWVLDADRVGQFFWRHDGGRGQADPDVNGALADGSSLTVGAGGDLLFFGAAELAAPITGSGEQGAGSREQAVLGSPLPGCQSRPHRRDRLGKRGAGARRPGP